MTEITEKPKRGARTLWALLALFLTPVLLAWVLFFSREHWQGGETVANGTLIQPARPLGSTELTALQGNLKTLADLKGSWVLLYVDAGRCDDICAGQLKAMTNTRLALGENSRRVQRLLVMASAPDAKDLSPVLEEYPGMNVATGKGKTTDTLLYALKIANGDRILDAHRIYLLDPMGNLMMYYPYGGDPKDMLKDLLRLLKYSGAG